MVILICILILIICILSYAIWNLLRKNEKQEDVLAEYLTYISNVSKTIEYSAKRLQQIDEKGAFKSDDEIGWFFEQVLSLQAQLNNFRIHNLVINEQDGKEK